MAAVARLRTELGTALSTKEMNTRCFLRSKKSFLYCRETILHLMSKMISSLKEGDANIIAKVQLIEELQTASRDGILVSLDQ